MYQSLPSLISTGVLLIVAAAAFWKGETPHRFTAAVITVTWLFSGLVQNRVDWASPQWGIFAVDVVVVLAITGAALRSGGFWLLSCAAFTWLQLMTHLAMAVDSRLHARAYLTALGLWSMSQLTALAWGTWEAWRARRLAG